MRATGTLKLCLSLSQIVFIITFINSSYIELYRPPLRIIRHKSLCPSILTWFSYIHYYISLSLRTFASVSNILIVTGFTLIQTYLFIFNYIILHLNSKRRDFENNSISKNLCNLRVYISLTNCIIQSLLHIILFLCKCS